MLNLQELVAKLHIGQKIALLTNTALPDDSELPEGMPSLGVDALWAYNAQNGTEAVHPRAACLANSFHAALFAKVAGELADRAQRAGAAMVLLPSPKAASSIYSDALSEDPLLSGMLSGATLDAVTAKKMTASLPAPMPTAEDEAVLDTTPSERVLRERMFSPFLRASKGKCEAIELPWQSASDAYAAIGNKMLRESSSSQAVQVCHAQTDSETVLAILAGKLLLSGSAAGVRVALENEQRIRRSMEVGESGAEELERARAEGMAISEEQIDSALLQRLQFLTAHVSEQLEAATTCEEDVPLYLQTARESVVLLKNQQNILPLRRGARVAIIGDIVFEGEEHGFCRFPEKMSESLGGVGIKVMGAERGYRLSQDRSDELIAPALELARSADVALVFLGLGNRREAALAKTQRLYLPANQLALLDALRAVGKKVVAVICGSRLPDVTFDRTVTATLLAPGEGLGVATALCEIFTGRMNPVGRLAFSGYENADADFRATQRHKKKGERKIGPFIGYRYTDSDAQQLKYPFGYGISYTTFSYANLTCRNGKLSFTVKNTGAVAGCEMPQVYVSLPKSARLRPRKELKSFVRVYLRPGEARRVELPMPDLSIFDEKLGRFVTEEGEYLFSVGSSVSHIALTLSVQMAGEKLTPEKYRLSDYLHSVSNIRAKSYTMEAYCTPMKPTSKLRTAGIFLLILLAFVDIVYGIGGILIGIDFAEFLPLFAIINGAIGGVSLFLFLLASFIRRRKLRLQAEVERAATALLFANAERVDGEALEELFAEEFEYTEMAREQKNFAAMAERENMYAYLPIAVSLKHISEELQLFFVERGVGLSTKNTRALLSAFLSARLVLLRCPSRSSFARVSAILSEFFGSNHYHTDLLMSDEDERSTLLFQRDTNGAPTETAALQAVYTAGADKTHVALASFSSLSPARAEHYLMPYVRYFGAPESGVHLSENGVTLTLPSNLWFLFGLASGESIADLPQFLANLASVVDITPEEVEAVYEKTPHRCPEYPQLEALIYRSKKDLVVNEDSWKSLDRVEAIVSERAPYHIGNKVCLQMEKFIGAYTACGGSMEDAMDAAICARVLPSMLATLAHAPRGEEALDLIQTMDSIFGEERIPACRFMMKHLCVGNREEAAAAAAAAKAVHDLALPVAAETAAVVKAEPEVAPAAPVQKKKEKKSFFGRKHKSKES